MNLLKDAGAVIDVVNGTIRMAEEKVPYKAWPEPALFTVEEGTRFIAEN